jgi:hypothetical protein
MKRIAPIAWAALFRKKSMPIGQDKDNNCDAYGAVNTIIGLRTSVTRLAESSQE